MATKKVTAEFYAFNTINIENKNKLMDFLSAYKDGHAPSLALDTGAQEQYQIRSIESNKTETVYKAVFGRCRYNEALEQAGENTIDKDVELLPGHGLVEKNHFLFYKNLNLIVFQFNNNASRIGKLQRYLSRTLQVELTLEAVLAEDSYTKLLNSGPLKRLELSIRLPRFKQDQSDSFLYEAIKNFQNDNAGRVKIVLSPDRGCSLSESLRLPFVNIARAGLATVARAKTEPAEDLDRNGNEIKDEIIDLILNKVKKSFDVTVDGSNKINVISLYAGLAGAKDECNEQLRKFFS